MIDDALLEAEVKMEKAVTVAKDDMSTIRTGRAQPAMFSRINVDYYGAPTPLPQLATITIPEARMAVVKPYDASQLAEIEKAIRDSDLGVNPGNDGQFIRVVFPQLTEERRREMAKSVRSKGEDAKISIRNIRRTAMETLDKIKKDGGAGEDDVARAEKELEGTTSKYISSVDDVVKRKEAELLEV